MHILKTHFSKTVFSKLSLKSFLGNLSIVVRLKFDPLFVCPCMAKLLLSYENKIAKDHFFWSSLDLQKVTSSQ
jgi:hypothetical protein